MTKNTDFSKRVLGKNLNAGQRAHIIGGTAENAAANTSQLSKVTNLKNVGFTSQQGVLNGISGSLLMAGGAFTIMKAVKLMRLASGLSVNNEVVEKAVDKISEGQSQEVIDSFTKSLKTKLQEQQFTDKKGFVSFARRNPLDDSSLRAQDFKKAVNNALDEHKQAFKNISEQDKNRLIKSLAHDLGFVVNDKISSLESYDPGIHKNILNNAYNSKDPAISFVGNNQSQFIKALEASGIVENGQVIKAPYKSEIKACCKIANIKDVKDEDLNKAVEYFAQKSDAVSVVPTFTNSVNMNKKIEAGFVGTVGTVSVILGAVAFLAMFSGFAAIAAASLNVAFVGIAVGSSLVVRDIFNEGKESIENHKLKMAHQNLKKEALVKLNNENLSPDEKKSLRDEMVEHRMQETLFKTKYKENGLVSGANAIFLGSIVLAMIATLGVVSGGAVGMIAIGSVGAFGVGAGIMVATKSHFANAVNDIKQDIKTFENLSKTSNKELTSLDTEKSLQDLAQKYCNHEQDIKSALDKITSSSCKADTTEVVKKQDNKFKAIINGELDKDLSNVELGCDKKKSVSAPQNRSVRSEVFSQNCR
ncbi:MAG: hypothetical protein ISQ32_02480 [Rickettsiales bacterium]|nr:hypothetical protein [Rickettsiales bacterium]